MNEADKEARNALDWLGLQLFQLIEENGHDRLVSNSAQPHEYIFEAVSLWLNARYPNEKLPSTAVLDIVSYFSSQHQAANGESDFRRNIANVGHHQRGRDYQWESDDLEPGHWEDHMSPPDWMVGD